MSLMCHHSKHAGFSRNAIGNNSGGGRDVTLHFQQLRSLMNTTKIPDAHKVQDALQGGTCAGVVAHLHGKPHGHVADPLSAMPSSCDHWALFTNKKDLLKGMTVAEIHLIRRAGSTPRPLLREDGGHTLQGAMACLLAVEEISSRCKVVARGKSNLAPRETGTHLQIRFLTDAAPGGIPCSLPHWRTVKAWTYLDYDSDTTGEALDHASHPLR